jgi:Icc-related predicted phosphoesterase
VKIWGKRRRRARAYRVFFATDIHGSDRCFRKFLAASEVYGADALVLGGDVAGKAIVPIVRAPNSRYVVEFLGERRELDEAQLDSTRRQIAFNGLYPWVATEAEAEALGDYERRSELFQHLIEDQLREWLDLARRRLPAHVRCVITPGNDDPPFIDAILAQAERIEAPERQVVSVGPICLASLGDTNRTPWATEREHDEDDLYEMIEAMLEPVTERQRLVLNFHCPPYDSGLDTALALDDELRPVLEGGTPKAVPVGSVAVRRAIERYRPGVGLHGHIHEGRGMRRVGSTVCLNPGSDYSAGVLRGAIVDFDSNGGYVSHLLTSG